MVDWIVGGTIAGACYLFPLLFGLALVVWGFWEFGKFMTKRQEKKEMLRKTARSLEEHEEIKQVAKRLLQFLEKNAETMPWGKVTADQPWIFVDSFYEQAKYFGHHQTATQRIELELNGRHYHYQLVIRQQKIVNGQMQPMTTQVINAEQVGYVSGKRRIKRDKELKQIFEKIFTTVVSVYKKRGEARKKKESEDHEKALAERKEFERELRTQTLKALNNNKISA